MSRESPAGHEGGSLADIWERNLPERRQKGPRAKGKGSSRLKEWKEETVAGTEPGRGQWWKLSPARRQGTHSQSLLDHCELLGLFPEGEQKPPKVM